MTTAFSKLRNMIFTFALGAVLAPAAQTNSIPANPNPARLVWIEPGTFTMGSPSTEKDRQKNERPQTQVTISKGFWMSKYEVTQEEYLAVMGTNPSKFSGDLMPVERVNYVDATKYCGKLNEQERMAGRLPVGYAYRLPTEAEWEYACRAGTISRFSYGNDLDYTLLKDYAWYLDNSGGQTHPVGQKLPNPWGLYDMHGNVWEWCLDRGKMSLDGDELNRVPASRLPLPYFRMGGRGETLHLIRGGSLSNPGKGCQSAIWFMGIGQLSIGFRPVLAGLVGVSAPLVLLRTAPTELIVQADAKRASQVQDVIVVAKVESRDITNPGTRSESAFYSLAVQESILGQPATPLSVGRYTQEKKHYLSVGKQYLLLLTPGAAPGEKAYGLRKYEPYVKSRVDTVREWIKKD